MPQDNDQELLPIVDAEGHTIGQTTRHQAHAGGEDKLLHPVVHLHLYDEKGEKLFLQLRPAWKQIQPNRWDTAVGGHVAWGESIVEALCRETQEEIGLSLPHDVVQSLFEEAQFVEQGAYAFNHKAQFAGTESMQVCCWARYVFETQLDRELVYVFVARSSHIPTWSQEVSQGRFFAFSEIDSQLHSGLFTPNFEDEWLNLLGEIPVVLRKS